MLTFASSGSFGADASPLAQTTVPWRKPPVYLADVDTQNEALDYAAGGFHVSVARGQAGGCTDDPTTWGKKFLAAKGVNVPCAGLGRPEIATAWISVAQRYLNAWKLALGGYSSAVYDALRQANVASDGVYAMESAAAKEKGLPPVAPPRDPRTGGAEAAGTSRRVSPWRKVFAATTVLGGVATLISALAMGGEDY
jgi:hypothetical protein